VKKLVTHIPPAPRDTQSSFFDVWLNFWFAPGDPIVLGLVRILCGISLVYVMICTTPLLWNFYGPNGWYDLKTADLVRKETPLINPSLTWEEGPKPGEQMPILRPDVPEPEGAKLLEYRRVWGFPSPRYASTEGFPYFSLWFHLTDPVAMGIAHAIILVAAVLFLFGAFTRITSVIVWAGYLSYVHRTPIAVYGLDAMMALLLLYLMIGPSGAALSVDRWLARRRAQKLGLSEGDGKRASVTFTLRLLQIHFCLIYLASGMSKLQGAAWWNGTATWQTASNYEFAGAHSWISHAFLVFLAQNRPIWELVMSGGALFTLALELGLPTLIWLPRWRWLLMCCSALLHTHIAWAMGGLFPFSLAMIAILASFTPPEALHWLLKVFTRDRTDQSEAQMSAKPATLPPAGRTAIRA
jgi:uncharacterized membrane protein YphA (DoxX/SURF4 family)